MLGQIRTLDTSQIAPRCLPLVQIPFQEPAGQRGYRQCGPSGYSTPGPNSG